MQCVMTNGLYLRADGRLPCYCGVGENLTLARLPAGGGPFDFVPDYFHTGLFRHIRRSQAQGLTPFPGYCDQCFYLDLDAPPPAEDGHQVLEWFHLEPTSRCNLDCQWCHGLRRDPSALADLSPELFGQVVRSLAAHGYTLGKGNICGVGEPTLNSRLWDMVRLTKESLGGDILLSTNGNGPYSPDLVPSGLDQIKIAVDAMTQEGYAAYRKHGQFHKVLDFTAKIAADKARLGSDTPRIIWQYILFNHNDDDASLLALQRRARDSGVDRLRIVYTRCDNYSARTPDDFPRDFPDILFFPIKEDSLLGLGAARERLEDIDSLAASGRADEAARRTIGLVKDLYHRLLLGVPTYADLLRLTREITHLGKANPNTLSDGDYAAFLGLAAGCYRRLVRHYQETGQTEQAGKYLAWARKLEGTDGPRGGSGRPRSPE